MTQNQNMTKNDKKWPTNYRFLECGRSYIGFINKRAMSPLQGKEDDMSSESGPCWLQILYLLLLYTTDEWIVEEIYTFHLETGVPSSGLGVARGTSMVGNIEIFGGFSRDSPVSPILFHQHSQIFNPSSLCNCLLPFIHLLSSFTSLIWRTTGV